MAANPNQSIGQNLFGGGFSSSSVSGFGAGVSDIFSGIAAEEQAQIKAQGDIAEGQSYAEAAQLAGQQATYTQVSTQLQEAQQARELNLSLGKTTQQVAGAGFSLSGSALDVLRSSAAQGSLAKAVTATQGAITEAGYLEQQSSYNLMSQAAFKSAQEEESAGKTAMLGGEIAGGLAIAGGILAL